MADSFLFIAIACITAVFDVSMAKDDNGCDIVPECKYSAGAVR